MAHLVFAGLGVEQIKRIPRDAWPTLPAPWTLKFVPNKSKSLIGIDDVGSVLREAASCADSHVIAVSRQRNRNVIANEIKPYFRFRWLNDEVLIQLMGSRFVDLSQVLNPILTEEMRWAATIKPTTSADALLLPRCCFRFEIELDIWTHCEAYNDADAIDNARRVLDRFRQKHFQKGKQDGHHPAPLQWIDENDYIFDHRGSRHADAPFPRTWKYSHQLEDRFHYDVKHRRERGVSLTDAIGRVGKAPADKHVNVDSHGYIR